MWDSVPSEFGVADDVDLGLRILHQRRGDTIQFVIELRLDVRLIDREGHVGRHPHFDLVAIADDAYARAGRAAAKLGFLLVHVHADRAACERADRRADRGVASVVAAAEHANRRAAKRADSRAPRGVSINRLSSIGIGRTG